MEAAQNYLVVSAKDLNDFVQVKFKNKESILIPLEDYFMMAVKLNSYLPKEIYDRYYPFQDAYKAYGKVKYRLSLKEQTLFEIQMYCKKNLKLDSSLTACVLDMVSKSKLIDDRVYALDKSKYFHETGMSEREIVNRLKKVGIEEKWIEEAVSHLSLNQEYENAKNYAKKVIQTIHGKSYRQVQMTVTQKLLTKGFSFDVSKNVVELLEIKEDDKALLLAYNKAKRMYAKENETKRKEKIRLYCIRKGFTFSQVNEIMEGEDE